MIEKHLLIRKHHVIKYIHKLSTGKFYKENWERFTMHAMRVRYACIFVMFAFKQVDRLQKIKGYKVN